MMTSHENDLYYVHKKFRLRRTQFFCTNTPYILKQLTEYISKRASQQEEGDLFLNCKMPKKIVLAQASVALSNYCETMQLALLPEPASRAKDS